MYQGGYKESIMLASDLQMQGKNSFRVKSDNNLDLFKYMLQPHFLFNSLNNLYALSVTRSEKTSDAIANLSQLLEKVVSYSRFKMISLKDEVNLIRDFIEMEKTWLGECSFLMDIRIKGNLDSISLPPLTIYTLVENAFKHGIRKCISQGGWITINILVKGDKIYCKIRNSCPDIPDPENSQHVSHTGIGLETVRKVLTDQYRNNYILDSKQVGNVYCADLLIDGTRTNANPVVMKVL